MTSIARGTIARAGILLSQAVDAELAGDRDRVQANLEAAISGGRNATFHLQKQYASVHGFTDWYAIKQAELKGNALALFFGDTRTFVVHLGPLPMMQIVMATLEDAALTFDTDVEVQIKRGRPWYRRHPAILMQDALRPLRTRLAKRRGIGQRRVLERLSRSKTVSGTTTFAYAFADAPEPGGASELVARYLDLVDEVAAEAEVRFGVPS